MKVDRPRLEDGVEETWAWQVFPDGTPASSGGCPAIRSRHGPEERWWVLNCVIIRDIHKNSLCTQSSIGTLWTGLNHPIAHNPYSLSRVRLEAQCSKAPRLHQWSTPAARRVPAKWGNPTPLSTVPQNQAWKNCGGKVTVWYGWGKWVQPTLPLSPEREITEILCSPPNASDLGPPPTSTATFPHLHRQQSFPRVLSLL